MKVSEIMCTNYETIKQDTDINEIARIFSNSIENEILVVDIKGNIEGIITHTDLLYKDIEPEHPLFVEFLGGIIFVQNLSLYKAELRKLTSTKASEIMTKSVFSVGEDSTIEQAAKMMVEKRIAHIPVLKDNKPVGVIRKKDVVKYVISLLQDS